METPAYSVGQAVYLRTDTPDFAEECVPFKNLDEMVRLCATAFPNLTLDKVIVYGMVEGTPYALTLSFVAASVGQKPDNLQIA